MNNNIFRIHEIISLSSLKFKKLQEDTASLLEDKANTFKATCCHKTLGFYLLLSSFIFFHLLLSSCSDTNELITPESSPIEIKSFQTGILSASISRATTTSNNLGTAIGRGTYNDATNTINFDNDNDKIIITTFQRTNNPVERYSYHNLILNYQGNGSWERPTEDDNPIDGNEKTLFWTDATSANQVIAYSLPVNKDFDWYSKEIKIDEQSSINYYYGSLGDISKDTIDFSSPEEGIKLMNNEDLLLVKNDTLTPSDNGAKAILHFRHALSCIRVNVNLKDYLAQGGDKETSITSLRILNQPLFYRWDQGDAGVRALTTDADNEFIKEKYEGKDMTLRKPVKLYNYNTPSADADKEKTFSFYGLLVPQDQQYYNTKSAEPFNIEFMANYADANTGEKVSKLYSATFNTVLLKPGFITILNIDLNHKGEVINYDIQYVDWSPSNTTTQMELEKRTDTFDMSEFN